MYLAEVLMFDWAYIVLYFTYVHCYNSQGFISDFLLMVYYLNIYCTKLINCFSIDQIC